MEAMYIVMVILEKSVVMYAGVVTVFVAMATLA